MESIIRRQTSLKIRFFNNFYKMEKEKIPLCVPEIGEEEVNSVKEVMKSGWLVHGPKIKEFEKEIAAYTVTKKAISVNSCTSALQIYIQSLRL